MCRDDCSASRAHSRPGGPGLMDRLRIRAGPAAGRCRCDLMPTAAVAEPVRHPPAVSDAAVLVISLPALSASEQTRVVDVESPRPRLPASRQPRLRASAYLRRKRSRPMRPGPSDGECAGFAERSSRRVLRRRTGRYAVTEAAGTRVDDLDRGLARAAAGAPQATTEGFDGDVGWQVRAIERSPPAAALAEGDDGEGPWRESRREYCWPGACRQA